MAKVPELADYHISETCGFLLEDPLTTLPEYFKPWEETAKNIAQLLEDRALRDTIHKMPLLDHTKLKGYKQVRLGYTCLSFITNCYVWQDGEKGAAKVLPRQVAIPICALAGYLGTKPALGYNTLLLSNWIRVDKEKPLHYTNVDFIIKFTKGPDFQNFVRVAYQLELCALPGIKACVDALKGVVADDKPKVIKALRVIREAVLDLEHAFDLFKQVDSDYFFFAMGPLTLGFGGEHSPLPDGLIYEDVSPEPKKAFLANAGQTPIVYTFDSTLGLHHNKGAQGHLDEVFMYMPQYHREFILDIRKGPSLKDYVTKSNNPDLTHAYNRAVDSLVELRSSHVRLVTRQMLLPSKKESKIKAAKQVAAKSVEIPGAIGFLKSIRDDTSAQLMKNGPESDSKSAKEQNTIL